MLRQLSREAVHRGAPRMESGVRRGLEPGGQADLASTALHEHRGEGRWLKPPATGGGWKLAERVDEAEMGPISREDGAVLPEPRSTSRSVDP